MVLESHWSKGHVRNTRYIYCLQPSEGTNPTNPIFWTSFFQNRELYIFVVVLEMTLVFWYCITSSSKERIFESFDPLPALAGSASQCA